jgi:hypothetical protein
MTIDEAKQIKNQCDGWIAAFHIFKRYDTAIRVHGDEYGVYLMPTSPNDVSDEDKEMLEALGWTPTPDADCFQKLT